MMSHPLDSRYGTPLLVRRLVEFVIYQIHLPSEERLPVLVVSPKLDRVLHQLRRELIDTLQPPIDPSLTYTEWFSEFYTHFGVTLWQRQVTVDYPYQEFQPSGEARVFVDLF